MKIFYVDPNNDTPQINYPFIKSMQDSGKVDIQFFTSFNRFGSRYYHNNYKINPKYIFFKFENKVSKRKVRQIFKIIDYPFYHIVLLFKVIRKNPDIIHFNWLPIPIIEYFFIKIFKLLGKKIILTQHNYSQHNKNKLRLFEVKIFKIVDKIICLSNYSKTQFTNNFKKKIVEIEHGNCYETELKLYSHVVNNKKKKKEFNILFVGAIKRYKGIELLLKSLNSIVNEKKITDIHLTIAGFCNKNYAQKIIKIISDYKLEKYISFKHEFLSNKEMYNFISHSDCGILPYIEATQSGIPFMFFSLYKPIVINDVGGLSEQVTKKIAIITKPNFQDIAISILKMKEAILKRFFLSENFDNFLNENSWEKTVKKYLDLYERVIN